MSVLFYGKPLDGSDWIDSESILKKDGKVFLFINDKWVEVDSETQFHVEVEG